MKNFLHKNTRTMKNITTLLNKLKSTSAGLFLLLFLGLISSVNAQILSNQSGDWEDPETWVGGVVPVANDQVIINDTHIVTLTQDFNESLVSLEIESGGILDLQEFNMANIVSFVGEGILKTRRSVPTATFVDFYQSNLATVELYNILDVDLEFPGVVPQLPNLVVSKTTNDNNPLSVILKSSNENVIENTLTINGNLIVSEPVNGGAIVAYIGNPLDNKNYKINVKGAVAVENSNTISIEDSNQQNNHVLTVNGNLSNDGTMLLTREPAAHYTQNPTRSIANLRLEGSEDVNFSINGNTTLNRLIINKSVSTKATLSADNTNRFKLFGRNDQANTSNKALYIQQGILELGNNIQIPSINQSFAGEYAIGSNSELIINGNNTSLTYSTFNTGATLGIFGELDVINGSFAANCFDLVLHGGALSILSNGTVNVSGNSGDITFREANGNFPSLEANGGVLTVKGQVRRRDPNLVNAPLNLTVSNGGIFTINGETAEDNAGLLEVFGEGSSLVLGETGTINIYGAVNGAVTDLHLAPEFYNAPESSNLGILLAAIQPGVANNFSINSTVSLPILSVLAINGGEINLTLENDLNIKKALEIINNNSNGATLHENNHNIEIEGNLSIVGGTFEPLTNTVTFSGFNTSIIRNTNGGTLIFNDLVINRDLGAEAINVQDDFTVNGEMTFSKGNVEIDENKSIDLKNHLNGEASFTYTGVNPLGTVIFSGDNQQIISGGVLPNVEIDNNNNVVTEGNITINGELAFTDGILDIGSYLLTLGKESSIVDGGTPKINTSGLEGMRGVRKLFYSDFFTGVVRFPILADGNEASVTIDIENAELALGTHITVKPIAMVTPLTTDDASDTELAIYWDIKQNGFDLSDPTASVSHEFQYAAAHEQDGDLAEYIPSIFTEDAWFTPINGDPNEFAYVDEVSRTITFNAFEDDFENPQGALMPEPKIAGVFTAGLRGEFGTVRRFISKANGGWADAGIWEIDLDGDDIGDIENAENEVPTDGDVVRIEFNDITSTSNNLRAYSLQVEGTLELGIATGATSGHRFNNITSLGDLGVIRLYPIDDNGTFKYDFDQDFNNIDQYIGKIEFAGIENAELPNNLTKVNSLEVTGGGDKILTTNLEVVESLNLTNGNLISSEGAKLTISETTALESGLDLDDLRGLNPGDPIISNSYVVGQVVMKGFADALRVENETLEFPIGSLEGNYRPLGLDFQMNGGGEYMLQVELIEGDANYEGIVYPGNLEAVSSLRYWKVTALNTLSSNFENVTASMSFDAAVDGINDLNNLDQIKLTASPQLGQPYTEPMNLSATGNVLQNDGLNQQFDGFGILVFGTTNFESNPLPVTLVSFEGKAQNDGVTLNWVTASEVNNSHFEVERSLDGENFEQIGTVEGFGTTTVTQNYSFVDTNSASGVVYYRLKQVDFDRAFEYSKIITVLVNQATDSPIEEFVVYPNPIQSGTFSIAKVGSNDAYASYQVTLQDVSGKVYYSKENTLDSASSELATMVNKLGSGVYLLRISNGGEQQVVRLLK